jgi:large subunit ribosomal protein L37Ae
MGKKKEVGSAGRFATRYGKKIRAKVAEIERVQKKRHLCPRCNMSYVERVSSGIWLCKKCGVKFAGLAYNPYSETKKKEG